MLYQQEYSKALIESSGKELKDVLAHNSFEIEIGLEKNFLNRALPVFSSAKKIYAVSVADVSSFWVSESNKALTLKFLDAQKNDEVYRLFVFSSPEQVVKYKNVLQANYRAYGASGGGVFICSYETYIKFMESFKSQNIFIRENNQQDFGVFIFGSTILGGEDEYVEGILDSNALRFRAFNLTDIKSTSYLQFMRAMENLSTVECGKYSSDYEIYRWCPNLYEDPLLFANVLSRLFDEAHDQIYHYLFIKGNEKVGEVLHQLCCKFRDHKKDLRITEANVYKTTAVNAIDGNYGGVIRIGGIDFEHYNYIFIVEFEDKKALEHYYNHKLHSAEREILYKSINSDVIPLYDKINTILKYKDISYNKMIEIYAQIEEVMKPFVLRIDIQKSMPLAYMCMQKGVPVGDFNQ
jgi:hypothetical protein